MADFTDLLQANQEYASTFSLQGFNGIAERGVLMVTCMDSRLEPLEMIGLRVGEAKILRTPGAHVTDDALIGCMVGAQLLGVDRILVVPHTRCAMGSGDDNSVRDAIRESSGLDVSEYSFGADPEQIEHLRTDVERLRAHRLIDGYAEVGGFIYDVNTGLLEQIC